MSEKNELIKKLESIWTLHNKALSIKQKMEEFVPEDHYERKVEVPEFPLKVNNEYDEGVLKILLEDVEHAADDAMEHMSKCYDTAYYPKKPAEPIEKKRPEPENALTNEYKQKKGCLPLVAGFVAACSLLSGSLFYGDIATKIINIVIMAVCAIVILRFYQKRRELQAADQEAHKRAVENYELEVKEQKEKYEQDLKEYQSLMNSHKLSKADFLEEYARWRKIYLESLKEEAQIKEKLEADRVAAVEKIEKEEFTPILEEMAKENGGLITTNYLPALGVIIDLLKSGRADDLKEAINLYEDMVYRERQLQLQREQEEQRRYEEEQRRADEERRYQEEMRFRKDQERQRQREEENRRADEERRHREDMKQREQQERDRAIAERERMRKEEYKEHMNRIDQERKQRSAGQAQCRSCLNAGRCNMQVHNNAPNCTGFRPR